MANTILIVGDTGTGKSTSIKTLNPKETFILQAADKALPFRGSAKYYNTENKNLGVAQDWKKTLSYLTNIDKEAPHIKYLILDDVGFLMQNELFAKADQKGFEKFTSVAKHMQTLLLTLDKMRKNLNVALMFHEEDNVSDNIIVGRKIKIGGKLIEKDYNPAAKATVVFYTNVSYDKDKNTKFSFITNRTKISGVEIPAKSPEGMFPEIEVPNDLNLVFETMEKYYNEEVPEATV